MKNVYGKPAEEFCLEGLRFIIARKSIRHMYMRARPDGAMLVSAPLSLPLPEIMRLASGRMDWVRQHAKSPSAPDDSFRMQPVWGCMLPVHFEKAARTSLEVRDGAIVASLPRMPEPQAWQSLLAAWHKSLVEKAAPGPVALWSARIGLATADFRVRSMKRRWGTCYPTRQKIILASQLATKSRACLEYVITHELLHFIWPNHGGEFKRALANLWPQWQELDRELDGQAPRAPAGFNSR